MPTKILTDKRVLIAASAIIIIALVFWSGSRYPSLNEKALMAGDLILEDPLGFEATIAVDDSDSIPRKIVVTFLNWVVTNWQGMSFGLLFAAAFMTFLGTVRKRFIGNAFQNSAIGLAIGAPLGVCVNCAAPIAKGMHDAGSRLETTLATLISSPSLNVLVVVMTFTLFPTYMAITRFAGIILFILIIIPVTGWLFGNRLRSSTISEAYQPRPQWLSVEGSSVQWFLHTYLTNLGSIVKTTIPLMILAGLLGSAVITLIPWDTLVQNTEAMPTIRYWLFVTGLGLIGLFLPVPIAFDVFICASLLSAGLSEGHVMILLTTLGSFSIYSFFIVARYISWQAATLVSTALILLAIASGLIVENLSDWADKNRQQRFLHAFSTVDIGPHIPDKMPAEDSLAPLTVGNPNEIFKSITSNIDLPEGLQVEYRRHHDRNLGGKNLFTRQDGLDLGFHLPRNTWLPHRYILPFGEIAGIAAGDINNDGWPDILVNSAGHLLLYRNNQGQQFQLQKINVSNLNQIFVGAAALVDLNNDGWLDLFFSGFDHGSYVIYSRSGQFDEASMKRIEDYDPNIVHAVGFADIDGDGNLEGVLGGYTAGHTLLYLEESRNALVRFQEESHSTEMLPGIPGETLSILFEDVNDDFLPDLLIGNDYQIPDVVYLNTGKGDLELARNKNSPLKYSSYSTMSISSGDINNDLKPELYYAQITGSMFDDHERLDLAEYPELCRDMENSVRKVSCEKTMATHGILHSHRAIKEFSDLFGCKEIHAEEQRMDCIAVELFLWSRREKLADLCDLFPPRWVTLERLCEYLDRKGLRFDDINPTDYPVQSNKHNFLFQKGDKGSYKDISKHTGAAVAGWTWNAKFADLDNDGWQDLFAVNGYFGGKRRESNMLFMNDAGKSLNDKTQDMGLTDHLSTGAFAYIDYDQDGDMDIVTVPFQSAPWVFQNNNTAQSLSIELRDFIGNRYGIGARVVIRYGDQQQQLREIKASGGYMSMEAPAMLFGIGSHKSIDSLEITWPDGKIQSILGPLKSGLHYRITRNSL